MVSRTMHRTADAASLANLPMPQRMMLCWDLCAILQVDVDALHVYDAVLGMVEDRGIRERITAFRGDHQRHVRDITGIIESLGMPVPEPEPSPLGRLSVERAEAAGDETEAMLCYLVNEHLSSGKYGECVRSAGYLPDEAVRILVQGANDEMRHFTWAFQTLEGMGARIDLGPYAALHDELECILGDVR